jgi:hypothetical protein
MFRIDEATTATIEPAVRPQVQPRWCDIDSGKQKNSEKDLFQCH